MYIWYVYYICFTWFNLKSKSSPRHRDLLFHLPGFTAQTVESSEATFGILMDVMGAPGINGGKSGKLMEGYNGPKGNHCGQIWHHDLTDSKGFQDYLGADTHRNSHKMSKKWKILPQKFNIDPEKLAFRKETTLPPFFKGLCQNLRGAIILFVCGWVPWSSLSTGSVWLLRSDGNPLPWLTVCDFVWKARPFFGNTYLTLGIMALASRLSLFRCTYSYFFAPWLFTNRRGLALLIAALGLLLGCHWAEWFWFCKSLGWLDSWIDIYKGLIRIVFMLQSTNIYKCHVCQ